MYMGMEHTTNYTLEDLGLWNKRKD
jgi:hypothetical protein